MFTTILNVLGAVCLIMGALLLIKCQNKTVYGILLIAFICRFIDVAIECFGGQDLPPRAILLMGLPSLLGIILMAMLLCEGHRMNMFKLFTALNVIASLCVLVLRIVSGILVPICLQLVIVLIFVRIAITVFKEKA